MIDTALAVRPINLYSFEHYDKYATRLINALEYVWKEAVMQPKIHRTFGQVAPNLPVYSKLFVSIPPVSRVSGGYAAVQAWTDCVVKLCTSGREDAALKTISLETEQLKTRGNFAQLSADLERFHLEELSDIVVVALLRNTYSIRTHIPYWTLMLDQAEGLLQARHREPRLLLRGLRTFS